MTTLTTANPTSSTGSSVTTDTRSAAAMNPAAPTSVLATLRRLIPTRGCQPHEALHIAERQATRLSQALGGSDNLDVATLSDLPRITVVCDRLPVSGTSHWNGHAWVICLNSADRPERQRFTLLHEFKHIIDHGSTDRLYPNPPRRQANFRGRGAGSGFTPEASGGASPSSMLAERTADYFAGCALVPKQALKAAWGSGLQRTDDLAAHFGVSQQAMEVRLDQTGLSRAVDPEPEQSHARCARPVTTPSWQRQQFRIATPRYTMTTSMSMRSTP